MFWITCAICPSSASTSQRPGSISSRQTERDPLRANRAAFSITGPSATRFLTGLPPFEKVSSWLVRLTERWSAFSACSSISNERSARSSDIFAIEMYPKTPWSRLLKSCAIPPASVPIDSSFCVLSRSSSRSLRSVMFVIVSITDATRPAASSIGYAFVSTYISCPWPSGCRWSAVCGLPLAKTCRRHTPPPARGTAGSPGATPRSSACRSPRRRLRRPDRNRPCSRSGCGSPGRRR